MPTVSVLLPFRDASSTLPDCLASISTQTFRDFELVAVDDGSGDDSSRAVCRLARRDRRIRLLSPGRVGLTAALNLGLAAARSSLVARMDADDLMHPERLRLQREYLAGHPGITLVSCRVRLFPEEEVRAGMREYVRWQNRCLSPQTIAANIFVESPFAHPSVMFRREAVERAGGYADGPFPEDYELWLRLHRAGHRMARLPNILLRWRERPDRLSRTDPRYSREAFDRLRAGHLATEPLPAGREVVVWGAGRHTRKRASLAVAAGLRPTAWVDIDPRKIGRRLGGLPVHPPGWLNREPRPFVLVYVTVRGARDLIAAELRRMGYRPGRDFLPVG